MNHGGKANGIFWISYWNRGTRKNRSFLIWRPTSRAEKPCIIIYTITEPCTTVSNIDYREYYSFFSAYDISQCSTILQIEGAFMQVPTTPDLFTDATEYLQVPEPWKVPYKLQLGTYVPVSLFKCGIIRRLEKGDLLPSG